MDYKKTLKSGLERCIAMSGYLSIIQIYINLFITLHALFKLADLMPRALISSLVFSVNLKAVQSKPR